MVEEKRRKFIKKGDWSFLTPPFIIMAETTNTRLYVSDRDYIESVKRKHKIKTNEDTIRAMVKAFKKHLSKEDIQ